MYLETNLSKIEHLASIRENENIRFRTFLKNKDDVKVDEIVHRLHDEIIPCRYLDGKKCSIYEDRPAQCRNFPYTNADGFVSRLWGMIGFYEICPIVFNLMERLKNEWRFRR